MIAVAIFPVFYFFFLKLNLFPVLHLCSVLPFCRLSVVRLCKVRGVIFEAILSPSERYQNIQDNLEYNSVLPFRIILKIFAVNMLYHYGSQKPDVSIFFVYVTKDVCHRVQLMKNRHQPMSVFHKLHSLTYFFSCCW